jgi:tetratricopeptide (TPR) repeat protein
MTIIDLRTYCKQIKQLIDTGQTEEAISHCMHILGTYPKHLDTYRVLGEAYLERKEQSEAADIFQRVLSSIPDDFVAHIGMSVIREEDEKLDEAIWHMERAFEVQPSNSTIQSEISRLYTSRGGIEPQKVRLTRGALARMYVKGSLYPQAIGELQAALTEDQNRFDLKVLLSDVYFKSGRNDDGIKTSEAVLSKLPYCFGANLLLANFYASREPKEEAKLYTDRLIELDPYIKFLDDLDSPPSEVPDSAVEIEKYISVPVILTETERALEDKTEQEGSIEEIHLIEKDRDASSQDVISTAAAVEIISEIDDDHIDIPSEELVDRAAVVEEIDPAQSSDWQQDLEEEPNIEEDTKPVVVAPFAEDNEDVNDQLEGVVENEPAQEGDIPDWLMELAEEDTSTELEQEATAVGEGADEVVATEETEQAEIETELPATSGKDASEDTSPELVQESLQADEISEEPSIESVPVQGVAEKQSPAPIVDSEDELASARTAIESGDKEKALERYTDLIKSRQNLTTIINDLEKAAEQYPGDAAVQRKLGDAYLRNHQINEAMQAYSKAEQHN